MFIIPAQKCSLLHYSCSKSFVIPLFLLKLSLFHYSSQKKHTLFHYSKNKISVIRMPLFLFSPRVTCIKESLSNDDGNTMSLEKKIWAILNYCTLQLFHDWIIQELYLYGQLTRFAKGGKMAKLVISLTKTWFSENCSSSIFFSLF